MGFVASWPSKLRDRLRSHSTSNKYSLRQTKEGVASGEIKVRFQERVSGVGGVRSGVGGTSAICGPLVRSVR